LLFLGKAESDKLENKTHRRCEALENTQRMLKKMRKKKNELRARNMQPELSTGKMQPVFSAGKHYCSCCYKLETIQLMKSAGKDAAGA